jgi:HD-like signal output (HDOD) protein
MSDKLCEIVESMYNLPPMPAVASQLLEMLQSPDYTADSLARLIACDPVLAGRLLSMANSAFYGVCREVYTLPRAIVILGEEALRSLVLTASLKNLSKVPGAIQQRLWEDSVGCALGAQMVAREFHSTNAEGAFLGGLFRHIGKMVMLDFDRAKYERLVAAVDAKESSQDRLEKEWFHFPHAVIGAAVLEKWKFNKVFIQATLHHDRLDFSAEVYPAAHRLAATVNIAGNLCRVLGIGCARPDADLKLSQVPGALSLGISYGQMKKLIAELETLFAENTGFFLN